METARETLWCFLTCPCHKALLSCLALERKGKADLTVTESYSVGIGYKLRICSSFMLETSPGKVADGVEILTFNIVEDEVSFYFKRIVFN